MEVYIQIPEPSDSVQQIAANATVERIITPGGKIFLLSVDLPLGVKCTIKKDEIDSWFFSKGNEMGTLRFICGIEYEKIVVTLQNTTGVAQDLHVRLILKVN